MKARVKATGEIVEVHTSDDADFVDRNGKYYMERIVILANRLAELVLMDWDKEEVIKLAKEVAVACKENIDFTYLVRKMREAQKSFDALSLDQELEIDIQGDIADSLEREVDEYLKKMEE